MYSGRYGRQYICTVLGTLVVHMYYGRCSRQYISTVVDALGSSNYLLRYVEFAVPMYRGMCSAQ